MLIAPDGFANFLVLLGHVHGSLLLRGDVREQLVDCLKRGSLDSGYLVALRDELNMVIGEGEERKAAKAIQAA